MARLIYSAITSLDGYVADAQGNWDWSVPDAQVHAAINAHEREIGTLLLGRRLYEVLVAWETLESDEPELREFAEAWRSQEKVVYSRTLRRVTSARTRLERSFDAEAVRALVDAAERDVSIGGPELAALALHAGLVDECLLWVSPVVVGGGKRALPAGLRWELELLEERRFGNGVVQLRYRTR
jgi:dihydrofolate reductase